MAPNPHLTYLDRVVMEIIETERMYVRDLRMIVEDYLAHIIDQADLPIRPEHVCSLFGNIEDIYEFNSELLQSLDMCDNDPVAIARCFVLKSEYFEIYTQYCTNYPNSVAALTECMRHKSLATFFCERQASLKRSLPLGSYLLKPVQRILKYHLLLQEIAKHFDPEEEGYEVVEEAIYTMTGVAWYINDMKRKHEHAVRLQEVQSLLINWKGPDLTMYGELVLEGTFKVHRAKNERTLFLFDRMLLITKRRGEHYFYKTHISCSTLMLIESAKDSLCFSVTHYKHPKQPHTIQAKTVEERKLWAHHIKRIILENHQAIIPQKAKEAILEMDLTYPSKYRYSPERRKKFLSSQIEDFCRDGHPGRRTSEPTKQVQQNTKAILKHTDSEGVLPGQVGSLSTTCSVNTLGCSLGESASEGHLEEEEEVILEKLDHCDRDEPRTKSLQLNLDKESDLDDIMIDDSRNEEDRLIIDNIEKERILDLETAGANTKQDQITADRLQSQTKYTLVCTESTEPARAPESCASTTSTLFPFSQKTIVSQPEAYTRDNTRKQTPISEVYDVKPPSSGESSEDEEGTEKEREAKSILPSSVLDKASAIAQHITNSTRRGSSAMDDNRSLVCPSSHLPSRTGSTLSLSGETNERSYRLKSTSAEPQGNLIENDPNVLSPRDDAVFDSDLGCHRRRDSTLSKHDQLLIDKIKNYYDQAENQDAGFGLKRRDSLTYIPPGLVRTSVSRFNCIPKEDASKTEKDLLVANKTNTLSPIIRFIETSTTVSDPTTWTCTVSGENTMAFQKNMESELSEVDAHSTTGNVQARSQSIQEKSVNFEKYSPSSEMIKVWQDMERAVGRSQRDVTGHTKPHGTIKNVKVSSFSMSGKNQIQKSSPENETREPHIVLDESDLSIITEEYLNPSPVKRVYMGVGQIGKLGETMKPWKDEGKALSAPISRVIQPMAEKELVSEESSSLVDTDMKESKVIHLARKYSQRIKTTKPVAMQLSKKNLLGVMEENSEEQVTGKPNLTSSLAPHELNRRELSPVEIVQLPNPNLTAFLGSSIDPSPGQSCSPPPEGFNWPDVRELRSKYVHSDSEPLLLSSMSRSCSVPERIDCVPKRRASCSSSSFVADETAEVPTRSCQFEKEPNSGLCSVRLHRAGSLDHRLNVLHLSKFQELQEMIPKPNVDVSTEVLLPKDYSHKEIVIEKVPEPVSESEYEQNVKFAKKDVHNPDENFIQIRSPTTREKISIMAVIDRCRAYQESDEYRQREEVMAMTKSIFSSGKVTNQDRGRHQNEQLDDCQNINAKASKKTVGSQQNMVKNLRRKFLNMN